MVNINGKYKDIIKFKPVIIKTEIAKFILLSIFMININKPIKNNGNEIIKYKVVYFI